MTRENILEECIHSLKKSNCILLELPTGFGKTALSLKLSNYLFASNWFKQGYIPSVLILIAKRVHRQTWLDEIQKWGGLNSKAGYPSICLECYESLHKHCGEHWDIVILDECHHIGSEMRMQQLKTIKYGYMIGLSATIPQKLKQWFKYNFHSETVSCDIIEAIDSEVLPEPTILLFPLQVENTRMSKTIELNPKAKGPIVHGEYKDYWKYKKQGIHAILKCTQKQKLMDLDKSIEWYKNKAMSGNQAMKQSWLYLCGKRLEFLADCKLQWVKLILHHLQKHLAYSFSVESGRCREPVSKAKKVVPDHNASYILRILLKRFLSICIIPAEADKHIDHPIHIWVSCIVLFHDLSSVSCLEYTGPRC